MAKNWYLFLKSLGKCRLKISKNDNSISTALKQKKLGSAMSKCCLDFRFNRFKKSGTYNFDFDWFLWSLSFTNLASRPRLLSFLIFCEFICSKYVFILWQISNIIHKDFIHWNTSRHWRRGAKYKFLLLPSSL